MAVRQCDAKHGAGQHLFHASHQLDWLFFGHGALKKPEVDAILTWQNQIPFVQKRQWTSTVNALNFPHLMKCETMNSVLTFVLGALILLDVIFALQTINHTREFRSLQFTAMQDQAMLAQIQQVESLARDAMAYDQKYPNPDLTRILQAAQTKPSGK